MNNFITSILICLGSISMTGQDTFHKLIYFDYPKVVAFIGVYPTDSCYYVVGNFTDTISPVTSGVIFGKTDLSGELLSFKTLNHPGTDYFNTYSDLSSTSDGNLMSAGGVYDTSSTAQLRIFSTNGDTLFTKGYRSILYPMQSYLVVLEVRENQNKGYAMLISFQTQDSPHDADISLLILDSSFQIEHYKSYAHSSKYEISNSLILDDDGGYIIGAKRTNIGQVLLNFTSRTLIIKTDSIGEVMWEYFSPEGILQDEAKAMVKTPDGGLVVASGTGTESNSNPNYHSLFWDALIFKLDTDQEVVWSTPFRGFTPTTDVGLTEMVEAPDGSGYVACGIVTDNPPDKDPYHDSWLVKVSPEGDSLWARHYAWFDGEFVAPEALDMKVTPDGGYVLVGYSLNVGLHVPGWIMKVDSFGCLIPGCHLPNILDEGGQEQIDLSIYPNPTSDFLNFKMWGLKSSGKKTMLFRIISADGKVIREIEPPSFQSTITTSVWDWPVGVYYLQYLEDGAVKRSEKFIKL